MEDQLVSHTRRWSSPLYLTTNLQRVRNRRLIAGVGVWKYGSCIISVVAPVDRVRLFEMVAKLPGSCVNSFQRADNDSTHHASDNHHHITTSLR